MSDNETLQNARQAARDLSRLAWSYVQDADLSQVEADAWLEVALAADALDALRLPEREVENS